MSSGAVNKFHLEPPTNTATNVHFPHAQRRPSISRIITRSLEFIPQVGGWLLLAHSYRRGRGDGNIHWRRRSLCSLFNSSSVPCWRRSFCQRGILGRCSSISLLTKRNTILVQIFIYDLIWYAHSFHGLTYYEHPWKLSQRWYHQYPPRWQQ